MNQGKLKAIFVLAVLLVLAIIIIKLLFNFIVQVIQIAITLAIIAGVVYLAYILLKKYNNSSRRNLK